MKLKKILALLLTVTALTACFYGCKKQEESLTMEGVYTLQSATSNGVDVTDDFLLYQVEFSGQNMKVVVNYLNMPTRRNSTYTATESKVTESYNGSSYVYQIDGDCLKTTFDDDGNSIDVVLKKQLGEDDKDKSVDFESLLFGESINDTKKFNYCPAILTEVNESGQQVMHVWYCTNKQTGIIMDHIGYRTGVLQANGKWLFSEEKIVLEPTAGTWDGRHTCDPSVIKGEFKYNDETYNYLMAYLGCTTEDYQKNETGLAVAKSIGGPWVKIDTLNPIVPWYDDGDEQTEQQKYESLQGTSSIYWGTGMPSLISVDGKGEVLLFYSSTKRGIGVRILDLSNLNNPVESFIGSVASNGVVNSVGQKCNLGIADFAYDKNAKRLYVTSVTNEKNPADVTKTLVNSHSMVCYVDGLNDMKAVCDMFKKGGYTWKTLGYVGPSNTGYARNHNPGLVKTDGGYIPDSGKIGVIVSTGNNDWANENIFTYRLFGHWFEVK